MALLLFEAATLGTLAFTLVVTAAILVVSAALRFAVSALLVVEAAVMLGLGPGVPGRRAGGLRRAAG